MRVGIEKIDLYAGPIYLDLTELAVARGNDPRYVTKELMCEARSVIPVWEDAVTLGANAAMNVLTPEDRESVELLIVGTESGVDYGKPISTWVHRFCGLPANCRNFEVKHACYGGTAALKAAAFWIASRVRPGKKALVVSADFSRVHIDDGHEYPAGGCAIAMLISANPRILELPLSESGYWTREVSDTFRPTSRVETGDNEISLFSYLDALEGAYEHFEQTVGEVDYRTYFKKHIYHAPFPGMAFQAHRLMLNRAGAAKAEVERSFQEKVVESLCLAKRVGTAYGSSNFVCLLGLLSAAKDLRAGDRISLFSYGSGCQSEFYSGLIGPAATEAVGSLELARRLDQRTRLAIEQYELVEYNRERYIDLPDYSPRRDGLDGAYRRLYEGRGLLVLKKVENYVRTYELS